MLESFRAGHLLWQSSLSRQVVALGNCTENGTVWCADNKNLDSANIPLEDLEAKVDLAPHDWKGLVRRMEAKAAEGDSSALWWVAWAHEGTNHPKSVWYYVAAMRRNPKRHGWALSRVCADARHACMQEGVPRPSLGFLRKIAEFNGATHWGDWQDALIKAQKARHRSSSDQRIRPGPRVVKLAPHPDQ